ncbi:hypothetical protein ACJMK2_018762 [Sinanodonta woodiana]|uniref:Uncharacterized protein n=1 Tax=Sinanodonta woodiana TaxID=1069815 RepID=A0ABD3UG22_SINWO
MDRVGQFPGDHTKGRINPWSQKQGRINSWGPQTGYFKSPGTTDRVGQIPGDHGQGRINPWGPQTGYDKSMGTTKARCPTIVSIYDSMGPTGYFFSIKSVRYTEEPTHI